MNKNTTLNYIVRLVLIILLMGARFVADAHSKDVFHSHAQQVVSDVECVHDHDYHNLHADADFDISSRFSVQVLSYDYGRIHHESTSLSVVTATCLAARAPPA